MHQHQSFTSNQISCNNKIQSKEIAKPITPPSESALKKTVILNKLRGIKTYRKIWLSLQSTSRKNLHLTNKKPPNFTNTRNKKVDTTPRYKNDNQTGQFGNQRAENVAGARETVAIMTGLSDTDEEIDEPRVEATLQLHGKDPGVPNADSGTNLSH
ncbi:hypothetical protein Tco_1282227 [Tanacetum coccineum]